MKREFKFEVGQYVMIADRVLDANNDFPKYPCKITYRFFDMEHNAYLVKFGDENEFPISEDLLTLYIDNNSLRTIQQMQKEIHDMQIRIKDLEIKVRRKDKDFNGLSASESNIGFNERRYDKKKQDKLPLPNDEEALPAF